MYGRVCVNVGEAGNGVVVVAVLLWSLSLKDPVRSGSRGNPCLEYYSTEHLLLFLGNLDDGPVDLRYPFGCEEYLRCSVGLYCI